MSLQGCSHYSNWGLPIVNPCRVCCLGWMCKWMFLCSPNHEICLAMSSPEQWQEKIIFSVNGRFGWWLVVRSKGICRQIMAMYHKWSSEFCFLGGQYWGGSVVYIMVTNVYLTMASFLWVNYDIWVQGIGQVRRF